MILERSKDVEFLNRVANHPSVHPWMLVPGPIDLGPVFEEPDNFALTNKHGGFILTKHENNVYEVHTLFLKGGRGEKALIAAIWCVNYVFTKTDGLAMRTFVADDNKAARDLALKVGFRPFSEGDVAGHDGRWYFMTIKDWAIGLILCDARN